MSKKSKIFRNIKKHKSFLIKKTFSLILAIALLSSFVYAASIERDLPSSANPGDQVTITLRAVGITGDYFAIVRENIPSGWTYISGGGLDASQNQVKLFVTSITGDTASYKLRANGGTATFSGTYQFTTDATPQTITGDTTLTVSGNGNGNGNGIAGLGSIGLLVIAGIVAYFMFIRKK